MSDLTRRNLFGYLAALGGIPLLAKEVETPKKLILDPGEVVRFDALAQHPHTDGLKLGTWLDTGIVHRLCTIPISQSAFYKLASVQHGRVEGFSVIVEQGPRGNLTDRILLDYPAKVIR